jgi:hypothetical protein
MPWQPWTPRPAIGPAARELITDPRRSDEMIATGAGCSRATVASVRARLERAGVIVVVRPADRIQRPRPPLPSRARDAITAGASTPREIADLAGISVQAAHKMLNKLRPRLADAAASADVIGVSIMPRQLQDGGCAADVLQIQATAVCARCGTRFATSPRLVPARQFCSAGCRNANSHALGHQLRPRSGDPGHHPPPVISLPPAPDWSRATCTTAPAGIRPYWTSDDREERSYARVLCGRCPVRPECEVWSLALPVTDNAIYGGMSQIQRLKARRAAMREIAAQALAGYRRT